MPRAPPQREDTGPQGRSAREIPRAHRQQCDERLYCARLGQRAPRELIGRRVCQQLRGGLGVGGALGLRDG